ncbi:uncharacterized protein LOC122073775 [Macadamia integrifolia]|uniref:uncharacterized protein LOC122073775 n=1 Tax=Macadamia integrifolia TaxID=60698 RepID=UPI001C4FFDD5|nr:uncharacterized protein LOC122073775 [Macadamia integrifolia]
MGSCFSSDATDYNSDPSTAKVISVNGNLREYPIPVTVSQVLEIESSSCFLSNSDSLFFDDYIPALDSFEELKAGQIYFVLPTSRLQYRLSAPDMAALAVKASTALSQSLTKKSRRNAKIKISPVLEVKNKNQILGINGGFDGYYEYDGFKTSDGSKSRIGVSRSAGSITKLQRSSSRRSKFAIQSFRMRLSTIYEGSIVD